MVVPLRGIAALLICGAILCPTRSGSAAAPRHDTVFAPVLIYHHVKPFKPTDDAIERGLTVPPAQFDGEMRYLVTHGYHTVTAAALVRYLREGDRLPSRPVVLTFDDGYADIYGNVFHTLRHYHLTATFFIVPGFLDTPRYLSWRQVADMAAHGMDVEAHTMTHPDLTTVGSSRAWTEVSQSRHVLEQHLHRSVRIFAYPYGDYNPAIVASLSRAGYWAAFTTHQGWWARRDQLLTLPRVYVDNDDTIAIFQGRLMADPAVLAQDPV